MDPEGATQPELRSSQATPDAEPASEAVGPAGLNGTAAPATGVTPNLNGAAALAGERSGDLTSASATSAEQTNTPARPAAARRPSLWPEQLSALASSFYQWLSRPRVRLTATGVLLLLIGGLFVSSSVWTLPLVIIGALMVVTAWVGHRLDGRFAVEWGEAGTQLEFRAQIKAPPPAQPAAARAFSGPHRLGGPPEAESQHAEILDGEAHTVEIEVAELKALIAAAETTGEGTEQPEAVAQVTRNLRVAYGGSGASDPRALS